MQKKLAVVGNSLALIIDKPIRRMLALSPQRVVSLRIDGRRLIVEPVDVLPSDPKLPEDPRAPIDVYNAVLNVYGLGAHHWARLSPRLVQVRYALRLKSAHDYPNASAPASPVTTAVTARLAACLGFLREGRSLDEAVDLALTAQPLCADEAPPAPPSPSPSSSIAR